MMRRFGTRAQASQDDIGWVFSGMTDLTLSILGMLFILLLYLVLQAARLGAGDVAMKEVKRRQEELNRCVASALASIGEHVEQETEGNVQTLRFIETGGRGRGGFFEMDSATPTARLRRILGPVRNALSDNQGLYERLMVQGHTDTQPTSREYAWQLSASRAASVVVLLTDPKAPRHVSPDDVLVSAMGYGEWFNGSYHGERRDAPRKGDYSTVEGWRAACRRVDLLLIYRIPHKAKARTPS